MPQKVKARTLKRYRRVLATYVRFAQGGDWDYSDAAAEQMFRCEALGEYSLSALLDARNGFAIGKHWKDLTVEMWREDIEKGYLRKVELLRDTALPLDMISEIAKLPDHPKVSYASTAIESTAG